MRALLGYAYGAHMATVSVTDLVLNFADACRALVPAVDRAEVPWRDGEQYDNWDRIAEALFESLVTEPCAFQAAGEAGLAKLRVARYGFSPDAEANAYVARLGDLPTQLITLSSVAAPFDHAYCEEPTGRVPLAGSRFVFVYDAGDGTQRLEHVDLAAN